MNQAPKTTKGAASLPGSFVYQKNISVSEGGARVVVSPVQSNIPIKDNAIQCRTAPLRRERRHYSIVVKEIDSIQYIMMGVGYRCWPNSPGWDILRALRYHSNDGGIFNGVCNKRSNETYTKGDEITCQVLHLGRTRCLVEFLKNRKLVFRQWVYVPGTQLYATIGFSTHTATLHVDWPLSPAPMVPLEVSDINNWLGQSTLDRSHGPNIVQVTEKIKSDNGVINIVGPRPLDRDFCYFEIEVSKLSSEKGFIAIGVVPPVFERSSVPGWTADSVGCHSDTGSLYQTNKEVNPDVGSKWEQGDVIGCGVLFSDVTGQDDVTEQVVVTVYFTRNGTLTHSHSFRVGAGGVFPCVGFHKNDQCVKINTQADCQAYKRELQGALSTLNVAEDLLHSVNASVTGTKHWLCSVDMAGREPGFVQLTSWPLMVETQSFTVRPVVVPDKKESHAQIEVGVAMKMTSSKEGVNWMCSYNLTTGYVTMQTPTGPKSILTSGYNKEEGTVTCMLDYTHQGHVLVMFHTATRILARGVFKRPADEVPVCATVTTAAGAGGAKLEVDWTRVLFPSGYQDWSCSDLGNWLTGDQTKVTPFENNIGSRQGSDTTIQAPTFFSTEVPYVELRTDLSQGQIPVLGVATAWSDLQSLIGSLDTELSFDSMTGEVITNNEIIQQSEQWSGEPVETLGVGLLLTKADSRAPQDAVVYFTINNRPSFQRVFPVPVGGLYATVTFPREVMCKVSPRPGVFPALTKSTCTTWLENIAANKQRQQQQHESSSTFSHFLATKALSQNAQEGGGGAGGGVGTTQESSSSFSTPPNPSPAQVVTTEAKIVRHGKISFTPDGEAVIKDENGEVRVIGALEKPEIPDDPKIPNASSATGTDATEKDEPSSLGKERPEKHDDGSSKASKEHSGTEVSRAEGTTTNAPVSETNADNKPTHTHAASLTAKPTVQPVKVVTTDEVIPLSRKKMKINVASRSGQRLLDDDFDMFLGHQAIHPRDNVKKRAMESDTGSTQVADSKQADRSSTPSATKESRDPPSLDSTGGAQASQELPASSSAQTPEPTSSSSSSSSSLNPQAAVLSGQQSSNGQDSGTGDGGKNSGEYHVRDSLMTSPMTNLLVESTVVWKDQRLQNAEHIQNLNEEEAKEVLAAINQNMPPQKMMSYLRDVNPAIKSGTSTSRLWRQKQTSKACTLS
ncbi:uncharacterized protein LOC143288717 [Babylonia areolata]|uniref:uncharacterized protein LOC143288717 n=1 Tax=Babylonia areolata TaxID=304850 RepID=UPI003FD0A5A2